MKVQTWKGTKEVSAQIAEKMTDIILSKLNENYTLPNGETVQANSISFIQQELSYKIRGIGRDLEEIAKALGFRVIHEARSSRNQKATIVTV